MPHQYKCTKRTSEGVCYLMCSMPNVYCKATAIKRADGSMELRKPHTHEVNEAEYEMVIAKKLFRDTLIQRAKLETKALRLIYDEEAVNSPNAAVEYAWPTAESSMRQARKKTLPPLPQTLKELAEYLDLNENRLQCNNDRFYQEWVVDNDGSYSIIFACRSLIDSVVHQGANELHADGTFKVVPAVPRCKQLFMMHLILQNHSIPVCYVLMENKTEVAYNKVLDRFKAAFPNIRPNKILTDYEIGLQNALRNAYPQAQITGCWFHFVQSLLKKINKLGYSRYVKQNSNARMCLKMTSVLPLLPTEQIREGFEQIKTYARNNGVLLPRFFTYFSSFWLRDNMMENLSVFNQYRRTNNNIESFHSNLKQTFQVNHPNLWVVLEHLHKTSMKYHIIIEQLARGIQVTRAVKIKYILSSLRIKNYTLKLRIGTITIIQFLLQCSHATNRYLSRELHWTDNDNLPIIPEIVAEPQPLGNPIDLGLMVEPDILIEPGQREIIAPESSNDSLDSYSLRPRRQLFDNLDDSSAAHSTYRNPSLIDTEQNEHSDSDESDSFIITPRRQLFENLDDSSATAYGPLVSEETQHIEHYTEQANWNEADFIIPEDRELDIWQQLRNDDSDGEEEITFVEVPQNLHDLYPRVDDSNICVVCRVEERTHALVPCGHRVLCYDCLTKLQAQRCPLCNGDFNMALRIW